MHDSIFFVLQASQSNQAPSMHWGGSPAASAPPTWPPPPLAGFWPPSGPGFWHSPLQQYPGQPRGYWPPPPPWGSPPRGQVPPPFGSPQLGTMLLRPTTSMPPTVRHYFIYLLDYFALLTRLFRISNTSIYMSFRVAQDYNKAVGQDTTSSMTSSAWWEDSAAMMRHHSHSSLSLAVVLVLVSLVSWTI
jgi:hypothetical protein